MRATRAFIHLSLLESNLKAIQNIALNVDVCACVKADAYGHSSAIVSRHLKDLGVKFFGVATVEEALELRSLGIDSSILLFMPPQPDEIKYVVEANISPFVADAQTILLLAQEASIQKRRLAVHLKIDTGMSRVGCQIDNAVPLAQLIVKNQYLDWAGMCTHFASSSLSSNSYISPSHQLTLFLKVCEEMKSLGMSLPCLHAANSDASLNFPASHLQMIRVGIALYGYVPPNFSNIFKPVMELVSKVAYVKKIPAGSGVSYHSRYIAKKDTQIAGIGIGYADGYCRSFSNKASLLINGRLYHVSGVVCMDQILVDIGDNSVKPGDEVVLFGPQLGENNPPSADDLAILTDTIPYEILCNISKRVPRVAVD